MQGIINSSLFRDLYMVQTFSFSFIPPNWHRSPAFTQSPQHVSHNRGGLSPSIMCGVHTDSSVSAPSIRCQGRVTFIHLVNLPLQKCHSRYLPILFRRLTGSRGSWAIRLTRDLLPDQSCCLFNINKNRNYTNKTITKEKKKDRTSNNEQDLISIGRQKQEHDI